MRSLKEKRRLDRRLTAILTGMFFFLSFSLFSRVGSWKLEPEKSASDETTQRCVRAQKVINSAERTKKDNGQKNGESQTREATTMNGVEIQLFCDGKLILHKIV